MRKLTASLCLTFLVLFTSSKAWSDGFLCSNLGILCPKIVDEAQIVEQRQGPRQRRVSRLKYEANSQTPFTGYAIKKYDNGQLKSKKRYKDGKQEGLWEEYYKNGQLKLKKYSKDGKEQGLWEEYHKNGQLKIKGNFKEGLPKDGLYKQYHKNGQLHSKRSFKDGKRHGLWERFNRHGQLSSKGYYKNGKQEGLWEDYLENGQVFYKGHYKDGKKEGFWKFLFPDGTVNKMFTGTYKQGQKIWTNSRESMDKEKEQCRQSSFTKGIKKVENCSLKLQK